MSEIGRQRLARQGVAPARFEAPEEVVRWMGALQAQDYAQGLWAIGVRLKDGTRAQVEAAIADGRIVRTWPMRGTLHFVPAEDAGWMVALSADRQLAASRTRRAQLGLDEAVIARAVGAFQEAIANGALTRPEMLEVLQAEGIDPAGQRGYHLLYYAAQTGKLVVGPMKGKQQTFQRMPDGPLLGREEALKELATRYVRSHAPATAQDFAWWAGLTLTDARRVLPEPPPPLAGGNGVHLLPGFDEFLLGYKDRGDVLDPAHAGRVVPGGNGVFKPMVVVDGRIVGTWSRHGEDLFGEAPPGELALARLACW